jgi:hypothetical protein
MLKTKHLLLDSKYAVPNQVASSNQFLLQSSYDAQFNLSSPLSNVKTISLKSIEMPLAIHNVRAINGSNYISLIFSFSTYVKQPLIISVVDGYYTIDALIVAINNAINANITMYPYFSLSLQIDSTVNLPKQKVLFALNGSYLAFHDSILLTEMLGFESTQVFQFPQSSAITAQNYVNMDIETHYIMSINNVFSESHHFLNRPATFKIPFDNIINGILYYNDKHPLQSINLGSDNLVINKLDVTIYDKWGFVVLGYNCNYCFTLLIDYLV